MEREITEKGLNDKQIVVVFKTDEGDKACP
jgi:hypothetical protein